MRYHINETKQYTIRYMQHVWQKIAIKVRFLNVKNIKYFFNFYVYPI